MSPRTPWLRLAAAVVVVWAAVANSSPSWRPAAAAAAGAAPYAAAQITPRGAVRAMTPVAAQQRSDVEAMATKGGREGARHQPVTGVAAAVVVPVAEDYDPRYDIAVGVALGRWYSHLDANGNFRLEPRELENTARTARVPPAALAGLGQMEHNTRVFARDICQELIPGQLAALAAQRAAGATHSFPLRGESSPSSPSSRAAATPRSDLGSVSVAVSAKAADYYDSESQSAARRRSEAHLHDDIGCTTTEEAVEAAVAAAKDGLLLVPPQWVVGSYKHLPSGGVAEMVWPVALLLTELYQVLRFHALRDLLVALLSRGLDINTVTDHTAPITPPLFTLLGRFHLDYALARAVLRSGPKVDAVRLDPGTGFGVPHLLVSGGHALIRLVLRTADHMAVVAAARSSRSSSNNNNATSNNSSSHNVITFDDALRDLATRPGSFDTYWHSGEEHRAVHRSLMNVSATYRRTVAAFDAAAAAAALSGTQPPRPLLPVAVAVDVADEVYAALLRDLFEFTAYDVREVAVCVPGLQLNALHVMVDHGAHRALRAYLDEFRRRRAAAVAAALPPPPPPPPTTPTMSTLGATATPGVVAGKELGTTAATSPGTMGRRVAVHMLERAMRAALAQPDRNGRTPLHAAAAHLGRKHPATRELLAVQRELWGPGSRGGGGGGGDNGGDSDVCRAEGGGVVGPHDRPDAVGNTVADYLCGRATFAGSKERNSSLSSGSSSSSSSHTTSSNTTSSSRNGDQAAAAEEDEAATTRRSRELDALMRAREATFRRLRAAELPPFAARAPRHAQRGDVAGRSAAAAATAATAAAADLGEESEAEQADPTGGWGQYGHHHDLESVPADRCDIDEVQGMPGPRQLKALLEARWPVVLRGAGRALGMPKHLWDRRNFLARFGGGRVNVSRVPYTAQTDSPLRAPRLREFSVADFVATFGGTGETGSDNIHDEVDGGGARDAVDSSDPAPATPPPGAAASAPMYLFASEFCRRNPLLLENMTAPFDALRRVPDAVLPQFPRGHSLAGLERGAQAYVGAPGSGASQHAHRVAANYLAFGLKRWVLLPAAQAVYSTEAALDYFQGPSYTHDAASRGAMECTQGPDDIVIVPSGWGHATLNVEASVGVAVEFEFGESSGAAFNSPGALSKIFGDRAPARYPGWTVPEDTTWDAPLRRRLRRAAARDAAFAAAVQRSYLLGGP